MDDFEKIVVGGVEYQYLLGKVSTCILTLTQGGSGCRYQYLLGKVSTNDVLNDLEKIVAYQYLLGKVSTRIVLFDDDDQFSYQYLLGKVSTWDRRQRRRS